MAAFDTPEAEIEAAVAGSHPDPFAFLGPHGDGDSLVIRTVQPGARAVSVVSGNGRVLAEAEKVHPDGLFVARLDGRGTDLRYRLRVQAGKRRQTLDDPYRFASLFDEQDLELLAKGEHLESYRRLGAHPTRTEGVDGTAFAVWAPNARRVSVVGDFNAWDGRCHVMRFHPDCGVWEIFLPGVGRGAAYMYEIIGGDGQMMPLKADPYAFLSARPPETHSIVEGLREDYAWEDGVWMEGRGSRCTTDAPISVYELHLGSWKRRADGTPLTYRELAAELVPYVRDMGFTHIELLPVSEHPFDGSWGYQPLGLYAPTSRFGGPDDFRFFVDACHRAGLGVLVDWVAGHFPEDPHGLVYFDGTHLYEHADPRQGRHQDWGTLIYNFGNPGVANFLLSNALFWLDQFHIDGLRVDAVASLLYLDYSRGPGEWVPNEFGGNENLEAIAFLKHLNEVVYARHPSAFTVAEESTAWPQVSHPVSAGGLGFGYKWNMGWMHDTLQYMGRDPIYREWHHDNLTFGLVYAFDENFMLPLSHDEVVHGKGSVLGRMPGDDWQRFANLRAYYAFMWTHPGKKLLFMGDEFGQVREWNHDAELDWHLLRAGPYHKGTAALVAALNRLYRHTPALHERDCSGEGFEWIDYHDRQSAVVVFLRKGRWPTDFLLVACNFTPVVREDYRIGVPEAGRYVEVLNTDAAAFGGSGVATGAPVSAGETPAQGRPWSLTLTLPPLATVCLKRDRSDLLP